MNYHSKFFTLFIIIILNVGCSPLRKSQTTLINNYFQSVTDYPNSVKLLNERVAIFTLESNNLKSSLQSSDTARVHSLINAVDAFESQIVFPDSILRDLEYLEAYIKSYYMLIPNGFNAYKAIRGTSEIIGGFFGLKSILSKVLPEQNIEITNVKKRKILNHIRSNQMQFEKSVRSLQKYINEQVIPQLESVDNTVKLDFELLFTKKEGFKSSTEHYFKYNRHFINYFQKLIAAKKLAFLISASLTQMLNAQKQVILLTSDRQKIGKESAALLELAQNLNQIKVLINKSDLQIRPLTN